MKTAVDTEANANDTKALSNENLLAFRSMSSPIPATFETLLCNKIAAANFAKPIGGEDGPLQTVMALAGAVSALVGPASMMVGLLAMSLSSDSNDHAQMASIMEQVSHLIDNRVRELQNNNMNNSIYDVKKRIEDATRHPYKWPRLYDHLSPLMNDAYGSCWNSPGSGACKDFRNDGKALLLAAEFTELLIAVCVEMHDYILTSPGDRVFAIQHLELLANDLLVGRSLVSDHYWHFFKRRTDFDSRDHGVLAYFGRRDTPVFGASGVFIVGPYDQIRETRICQNDPNRVDKAWLDRLKYECQVANRRRVSIGRGGCEEHGPNHWYCKEKGPATNASCYQPRLDACAREYKAKVLNDLKNLEEKVQAIKSSSWKIIDDAIKRCRSEGQCNTFMKLPPPPPTTRRRRLLR